MFTLLLGEFSRVGLLLGFVKFVINLIFLKVVGSFEVYLELLPSVDWLFDVGKYLNLVIYELLFYFYFSTELPYEF